MEFPRTRKRLSKSLVDVQLPEIQKLTAEQKQSRIMEAGYVSPKSTGFGMGDGDIPVRTATQHAEDRHRISETQTRRKIGQARSQTLIEENEALTIRSRENLQRNNRLEKPDFATQKKVRTQRAAENQEHIRDQGLFGDADEKIIRATLEQEAAPKRQLAIDRAENDRRLRNQEQRQEAFNARDDAAREPDLGSIFEDAEADLELVNEAARQKMLSKLFKTDKDGLRVAVPLSRNLINIDDTQKALNGILSDQGSIVPLGRDNPDMRIPVGGHLLKKDMAQLLNRALNVTPGNKTVSNVRRELARMFRSGRLDKPAAGAINRELDNTLRKGEPLLHNGRIDPIKRERLTTLMNDIDAREVQRRMFGDVLQGTFVSGRFDGKFKAASGEITRSLAGSTAAKATTEPVTDE